MPGTVRLHRVLATKPEKVYRAFLEADAMAKWIPPNGFRHRVPGGRARTVFAAEEDSEKVIGRVSCAHMCPLF